MSTRSVIARVGKTEGEFIGRYFHWDGSPTTRGPLLWKMLHSEFKCVLPAMLRYLLDEHTAGWSSPESRSCYCHPWLSERPEFRNRPAEESFEYTQEQVQRGETDIEYLYVFDEEKNTLAVRDVSGDAEILTDLAGPEPDWTVIECGENFERCSHYAWYHNLLPKTSNLSTKTWLGYRLLDFHDAVGFAIKGKRYASTGCGRSSNYHDDDRGKFPANTWVATVKAKNGRRIDVAVAKMVGNEYKPIPGVVWIYPPTKNNPTESQETVAS